MLAAFFFILTFVFGQPEPPFGDEKAYEGAVVLADGHVITGSFFFNEKTDLLYRKVQNRLEIIPAYQLQAFYFYDEVLKLNRKFIMHSSEKADFPYQLYEIVIPGEVMVLRKRKEQDVPVENGSDTDNHHHAENYHYHLLYKDQLLNIRQFATVVFPDLKAKEGPCLEKVIQDKNLNIHKAASVVQLIREYIQLRKVKQNPLLF